MRTGAGYFISGENILDNTIYSSYGELVRSIRIPFGHLFVGGCLDLRMLIPSWVATHRVCVRGLPER